MKHQILSASAILFICICGGVPVRAQAPPASIGEFRIGLSGGATYNLHSGDAYADVEGGTGMCRYTVPWNPSCRIEVTGPNEWGYSAGVVAEYVFGNGFGLASHVLYSTHPRSGSGQPPDAQVLVPSFDGGPPTIATQVTRWDMEADYDLLEIDLLGKGRILDLGDVGLGLAFGFAVGHTRVLEESDYQRIVLPANARFIDLGGFPLRDSGRTMVLAENEPIRNASPTRFSLRSGVFVDVELFDRFHVTPGMNFDVGLTPVVHESTWLMNVLMFQLDVTTRL